MLFGLFTRDKKASCINVCRLCSVMMCHSLMLAIEFDSTNPRKAGLKAVSTCSEAVLSFCKMKKVHNTVAACISITDILSHRKWGELKLCLDFKTGGRQKKGGEKRTNTQFNVKKIWNFPATLQSLHVSGNLNHNHHFKILQQEPKNHFPSLNKSPITCWGLVRYMPGGGLRAVRNAAMWSFLSCSPV